MPNLAEIQAQMADADPNIALEAARTLANYYGVYNDEYNVLLMKRQEAETAIQAASTDSDGVDHANLAYLMSLKLNAESRMKFQDGMMIAFQASGLSIAAPDAVLITQVRQLCQQVSQTATKSENIQGILLSIAEIARLVNQVQGS